MEHPSPLVESTGVLLRICSYLFIVRKHQTHVNNCIEINLRIFLHSGFTNYRNKEPLCVDHNRSFLPGLALPGLRLKTDKAVSLFNKIEQQSSKSIFPEPPTDKYGWKYYAEVPQCMRLATAEYVKNGLFKKNTPFLLHGIISAKYECHLLAVNSLKG